MTSLYCDFLNKCPVVWRSNPISYLGEIVGSALHSETLESICNLFDSLKSQIDPLPPYYEICDILSKDTGKILTNEDVIKFFLDKGVVEIDEGQLTFCYDLAWKFGYPYIYPLASEEILPNEYVLNFLWINLNPQDRVKDLAMNIFGEGLEGTIQETCISKLSDWAMFHPQSLMRLWFDSALVTEKALSETFRQLREAPRLRSVDFELKDIRSLEMPLNIQQSLHPGTPVYYRVDLAKVLINQSALDTKERKYSIFCDFDIKPLSAKDLFDQRTLSYLEKVGYVFLRENEGYGLRVGPKAYVENSFFIFNTAHRFIQNQHKCHLIEHLEYDIESKSELLREGVPPHMESGCLWSQTVASQYSLFFRNTHGVGEDGLPASKKIESPLSTFTPLKEGGRAVPFENSDHRAELWGLIYGIPHTIHGRRLPDETPGLIKALEGWDPEPLELPKAPVT